MAWIQEQSGSCLIRVKAVPGARADTIAGLLGDRLKVRVSAPPEGGRANAAIERLVAKALEVKAGAVEVQSGFTSPEKVLLVRGVTAREVCVRLGIAVDS